MTIIIPIESSSNDMDLDLNTLRWYYRMVVMRYLMFSDVEMGNGPWDMGNGTMEKTNET